MEQWQCCRMCLGVLNLHPIFTHAKHHEKYSQVVLEATGVQITMKDALPHLMCATCIKLTNETYKFRRKCQDTQKSLMERVSQNTIYNIKVNGVLPDETKHSIDITDLIVDNKDFNSEHIADKEVDFDNDVTDNFEDVAEKLKVEKVKKDFDDEVMNSLDVVEKLKVDKKVRKKVKRRLKEPKRGLRRKEEIEKTEIECEYCHKILTSKLSLRNHYKIHTGFDVVCEHCGKKFITRRLLLMHCKAKHGYEKTDKCSFCDYRASNAEQVKIHERLHTGEKPYVCATCGVGFHRKSSYLQHVAIHLPEKTVQCTQCPARFKSVTLMRIHANRHRAAQYTYKCVVCKHNFARRRNVARHLLRIHAMQPLPEHIERSKCV